MAMWLRAENDYVEVEDHEFTLEELQKFVGGYIEIVRLPFGQVLIVNEEGLLKGLPFNLAASEAAGRRIVGDALLCKGEFIA